MNFDEYYNSLSENHPPDLLSVQLAALWYDAKGNWKKAHELVNDLTDIESAWVHAYLHRKEGDDWNAGYWYQRAGKPHCTLPLNEEWESIVRNSL
jgi:hypothetical protein